MDAPNHPPGTSAPVPGKDTELIRFEKVCKAFGSKVVLKDLDLVVHRGESLVLMGPSGTGKSVTLRHVVGLSLIHISEPTRPY